MISYNSLYLKLFMEIILIFVILLYSAILHEIAHGYVAYRFGDPTAKLLGRLTLNPISHLDLFMSFLLPLSLYIANLPIFGGAKPVPVDPFNLRDGRKDFAIISLAGPLTNIVLAILAGILIHVLFPDDSLGMLMSTNPVGLVLGWILRINLLLAIFNLLPIPPLDGSKIFALLLPEKQASAYLAIGSSPFGFIFLLLLLMSPFGISSLITAIYTAALSLLGF